MSTTNTIKQPLVTTKRVVVDVQRPLVITACVCLIATTIGGIALSGLEVVYGKRTTNTKKSNKRSRK